MSVSIASISNAGAGGGVRQYAVPLVLAVLLHVAAGLALRGGWNPQPQETRVIRPQIVQSTLVMIEPQTKPAPQPPAAAPKPAPRPEPAPKPRPPPPKPEPKPEPRPEPKPEPQRDLEAERRAREEAEARQQRLDQLAEASFLDALQDEAEALDAAASASAASEADAIAQSYRVGIYQAVVANWSRPPSARNHMEAKLLVELVPTGELVSVTLLESSGNAAFDRSAEAAVRRARRFEVPRESEIFESYFRRFTLLFRPEDLLR